MKNKNKFIGLLILVIIISVSCMGKDKNNEKAQLKEKMNEAVETKNTNEEKEKVEVPKILLKDQYGKEHNLEDYKGKVVFINFWATWCGYCIEELPYLERLAKDYADDIVVLGIAGPKSDSAPKNPDITKDKIIEFIEKKKVTYPILFDETGKIFAEYGIKFFPTSFVLDRDGYLAGYIPGGITEENLRKIAEDAIKLK